MHPFASMPLERGHHIEVWLSTLSRRYRCCSGGLFVWVGYRITLPQPNLRPLLGDLVFDKGLSTVLGLPLSDISRIPQFAGYAQIFTTSHKRVGLTPLRCGRDPVLVEVVLFTSCNRDQSGSVSQSLRRQSVEVISYRPLATNAYSRVTALSVTIASPRGANPQPPGPNARLRILL